MRQASLWSTKEELARTELWDGLPEAVRREFVDLANHRPTDGVEDDLTICV